MKALIDRRELQVIRRRSNLGKDEKARRGLLSSGRPAFGYKTTGEGRDRGQRTPNEEEAPIVRTIFEFASQGLSISKIIRELHNRAISPPTSRGRASGMTPTRFRGGVQLWSSTTLKRLLSNPIYKGVAYRNCWVRRGPSFVFDPSNEKAIWIKNAHEPIVDAGLFDRVQEQLAARACRGVSRHMLTGLMRCPACKGGYRSETSRRRDGTSAPYYVCSGKREPADVFGKRKRNAARCQSKWQPGDATDSRMWAALVGILAQPS
ncbi:MAG: recombinase family protein, partial [Chloroflexi bacterium]|nr:recombinase family protein [Chloroflexota bacterium]